jgi:ribonuclease T1
VFLVGLPKGGNSVRKFVLAFSLASLGGVPVATLGKESRPELPVIAAAQLPAEARATDELIRAGGPFPYAKDGSTFGNRERHLPAQRRGYYREYTVRTPGTGSRGARRIVCGGSRPTAPDACFYTDDHYASFKRIVH